MIRSFRALRGRRSAVEIAAAAIGLPTFRASSAQMAAELARARRYERTLSVLVLGPHVPEDAAHRHAEAGLPFHPGVTAFVLLGSLLRDGIRQTDVLTQLGDDNLYAVVLPEDGVAGARSLANRIAREFAGRTSLGIVTGIAEFPQEGFTLPDLLERARRHAGAHTNPEPDDEVRAAMADG